MSGIGVGLIGTGFMGKCHALAFRAVPSIFEGTPAPRLEVLADVDAKVTERLAEAWGFGQWTTDWRELVRDPKVDVVAITSPNFLHQEMALAAIAAGKHVYCEKPLALDAAGARLMTEAAEAKGVRTLVGYNYLCAPALRLAKELIEAGDIGEIVHVRGTHFEDYMTDPADPATWRSRKATAGAGALGDLGSHVISLVRHLAGEIEEVQGATQTMIRERPSLRGPGSMEPVEVDDQAQALLRFESGAAGVIEASWLAAGRKMGLTVEVTGSKGAMMLNFERKNELRLFRSGETKRTHGFRTILMGPEHQPYGRFCPAPGHQLGFNDLKVIEVKGLLDAIATGTPAQPDFRAAWRIAQVVDAILLSAAERRPVGIREIAGG
jgi:predicted dehydrogenase